MFTLEVEKISGQMFQTSESCPAEGRRDLFCVSNDQVRAHQRE